MTGVGKAADRMGRKALMWSAAVALAAGTGALLPAGTAAAATSPTHARGTLRVAATGSDRGNCRSSPCKTLGHALTQASRNDTVVIYPGIYHESGNANVVKSRLTGLRINPLDRGPAR